MGITTDIPRLIPTLTCSAGHWLQPGSNRTLVSCSIPMDITYQREDSNVSTRMS